MGKLSIADRIYVQELDRAMKFYRRIAVEIKLAKKNFREPERTIVGEILGGKSAADVKIRGRAVDLAQVMFPF